MHANANIEEIKIDSVYPSPNYSLTKDESDIEQLADGHINKFPIWTKKSSVAWVQPTPVVIVLHAVPKQLIANNKASLAIHTNKYINSGILLPLRIDVYGIDEADKIYHAGEWSRTRTQFPDKLESFWINIELQQFFKKYVVVIHSGGKFLTIDELKITTSKVSAGTSILKPIKIEPKEHSIKKLILDVGTSLSVAYKNDNIGIRRINPWAKIIGEPYDGKNNELKLFNDEIEPYVIELGGVINKEICLGSDEKKILNINILKPVYTLFGVKVYDAIIPLENNCLIADENVIYLWLEFDGKDYAVGNYEFVQDISVNGKLMSHMISVEKKQLDNYSSDFCPDVGVWSYHTDKPIWEEFGSNHQDLVDHKVNNFFMPPNAIPDSKKLTAMLSGDVNSDFNSIISQYRGHGRVILFLAWDKKLRELYGKQLKDNVQKWVKLISQFMNKSGFEYSEWALYPIDEPKNERMDKLLLISKYIKEADSDILIYANPILGKNKIMQRNQLHDAKKLFDIWQPSKKFIEDTDLDDFINADAKLWVYENSNYPPKQTSPDFYLNLFDYAYTNSLNGVSVWSYSSTNHTSAWDDYDGNRPDWSLVYEGGHGPISSRRWEAIRDGAEDFCFRRYLEQYPNQHLFETIKQRIEYNYK